MDKWNHNQKIQFIQKINYERYKSLENKNNQDTNWQWNTDKKFALQIAVILHSFFGW